MSLDMPTSSPSAVSGVSHFVNEVRCYALTEWRVLWRERTAMVFIFILPAVLGFFLWTAGPMVFSAWISFHEWDLLRDPEWTGLGNYRRMLDVEKPDIAAVCNDNGARAAGILAALERGMHVIAEKPLAQRVLHSSGHGAQRDAAGPIIGDVRNEAEYSFQNLLRQLPLEQV